MLRWAVMGTGLIAAKVLPCIRAAAGNTVTCIASRDVARAKSLASGVFLPETAACDYEQLLARSDVDAVYVTVPNSLHTAWSVRLLEAGKHVLCEKPLTPRRVEAEQIASAAKQANRLFTEGFMYLHHPQTARLMACGASRSPVSAAQDIGRLKLINAAFCLDLRPRAGAWTRFSHRLEGGAMMDLGCYPLSLARAVTGEEPERITALATPGQPLPGETRPVDATTAFVAVFPCGVVLHALCSIESNSGVYAELVGETGKLRTETPFRADPVRAEIRLTRFENHPNGAGEETIVIENGGDRFVNQFTRFADAVRGGRQMLPSAQWSIGQAASIEEVYRQTGLGW